MPLLFDDFTTKNYRELLRLAKNGWVFSGYADADSNGRVVLWRHDVDISVHRALSLAKIEHEEGVGSTYFLMPHSAFYNLMESEIARKVEAIIGLGHSIGLHFDPSFYAGRLEAKDQLLDLLACEKALLESLFGVRVEAFSWHNPTVGNWLAMDDDELAGMVNAYGVALRTRYTYVSDSNGIWRHSRLRDVLERGTDEKLHVLTHPEWWQELPMSPRERVFRSVDGRAVAAMRQNDALLAEYGRNNAGALDDEFRFLKEKLGRKAELLDYRWLRGESVGVFVDLWRIFESQLVKFCRIWFRKVLKAPFGEVRAVIESPRLRLQMHKVFAAIYKRSWADIFGVAEEEFLAWQQVRSHLVHGLCSYPRGRLEEGIVFLVRTMKSLADFGQQQPVERHGLAHAGQAGLPRLRSKDRACVEWLTANRDVLGIDPKALQDFVDQFRPDSMAPL